MPPTYPDPVDEARLISALRAGEPGAAAELVRGYQSPLYGLALRMVGNHQDAEDVVQETFVRAVRGIAGFDGGRSLRPWLLGIAANRCRTLLERRRRRPIVDSGMVAAVPARGGDPADHAAELAAQLARGLGRLRPEYRLVFLLFHEQGLPYEEIGRVVDRPIGTVKTWIHRARLELAEYLQRQGVAVPAAHARAAKERS